MTVDIKIRLRIRYEKDAQKFFDKHEKIKQRYEVSVKEFFTGEHPERIDLKPIKGKREKYYRIKLGQWRVMFTYDEENMTIIVDTVMAGARGDFYKKIGGLKIL